MPIRIPDPARLLIAVTSSHPTSASRLVAISTRVQKAFGFLDLSSIRSFVVTELVKHLNRIVDIRNDQTGPSCIARSSITRFVDEIEEHLSFGALCREKWSSDTQEQQKAESTALLEGGVVD